MIPVDIGIMAPVNATRERRDTSSLTATDFL
jgi:hypothetical protein